MSINLTHQEMADLVFECAVATLKRIDRPYIKVLAIIPVVGAALGPTNAELQDALGIEKAKAEKEAENV